MNNKGKNLEALFQRWCKELNLYCQRFYDARSMRRANAGGRPADFWVYPSGKLAFIEVKDYPNNVSLPLKAFSPAQYKGYKDSVKYGFHYWALVRLRQGLFLIDFWFIDRFFSTRSKASIPAVYFKTHGKLIKNKNDLRGAL